MKSYRTFVFALLTSGAALCVNAQDVPTDGARLPIADVHFHYMAFMTPDELRARMDRHNIRWVVSAGAQGAGGAAGSPGAKNPWLRDSDLHFELKERFVAAVGGPETFSGERRDGPAFFTDAANLFAVAAVERMNDLLKQDRRTFVELFPNAENSSMEPMRRRRLPTNAPFFKEVMRLATRYSVPVPMHMEWHPDSVAQLSDLLTEFPQANVVLSHCGKITVADDLRLFFQKHSNVYCDLGYRSSPQGENESRKDPRRMIFWSSNLLRKADIKPDWLKLVEDFPDRFMLAIDDVVSWDQYDQVVAATRDGVLAKLTPATAEKVAYRNAVKLFGLSEIASAPSSPSK
jgi:predicted TIM-barrel fold metal-dependent hydrolase